MSKQSLLLVDGDTRSLRVLEVSLRKAGFTVTAAISVKDALDKLEVHTPDLIISETKFATDIDGFELRRRIRAEPEWAEIPFVFLTTETAIENKIRGLELGVEDYLTKPIYIKEIVTRINILLQKRQRASFDTRRDGVRFAGRVADMPIVDVIQTIEVSRKSGVINFVGMNGRQAAIYFRDGRVIDAEAGTLQGEDAVYRLLTWNDGEFEVEFRTVRRREAITASSQGLLMEGMRRLDEWTRLLEQLPPLTHRFEIDFDELARRLGEVPDDNNRILRLIDGKRSLIEVIDASDVGDLECLQAVSRLYFEGLLVDLDPDKRAKRESGRPVPLVVVEAPPTPIEEVASGPVVIGALALRRVAVAQPIEEHEIIEEISAGSLRARVEEVPHRPSPAPSAADPTPAMAQAAEPSDPAPSPLSGAPLEPMSPSLSGSFRPSGLRLIDEAVAAAQLIEPSLFEAELEPSMNGSSSSTPTLNGEGNGAQSHPADDLDDLPADLPLPHVVDEEQTDPAIPGARRFAATIRRDDSSLRMIGSAGRDRAEASGELSWKDTPTPRPSEREMVTILPRRITREHPVVSPADVDADAPTSPTPPSPLPSPPPASTPAPVAPVAATTRSPVAPTAAPIARPAAEPVRPADRPAASTGRAPAAGVRGPGPGAKVMLALAFGLAAATVYTYCHKRAAAHRVPADARLVTMSVSLEFDDAGSGGGLDAHDFAESPLVPRDAPATVERPLATGEPHNVPPGDARSTGGADARVRSDASAPVDAVDRKKQAAQLLEQAQQALEDGDPDHALDLADQSLKLRRTQKTLLERAHALQRLGRIDDALKSIDDALEIGSSAPAWEQRAMTLWSARRYDEARTTMEKYLELFPAGAAADSFRQMMQQQP